MLCSLLILFLDIIVMLRVGLHSLESFIFIIRLQCNFSENLFVSHCLGCCSSQAVSYNPPCSLIARHTYIIHTTRGYITIHVDISIDTLTDSSLKTFFSLDADVTFLPSHRAFIAFYSVPEMVTCMNNY